MARTLLALGCSLLVAACTQRLELDPDWDGAAGADDDDVTDGGARDDDDDVATGDDDASAGDDDASAGDDDAGADSCSGPWSYDDCVAEEGGGERCVSGGGGTYCETTYDAEAWPIHRDCTTALGAVECFDLEVFPEAALDTEVPADAGVVCWLTGDDTCVEFFDRDWDPVGGTCAPHWAIELFQGIELNWPDTLDLDLCEVREPEQGEGDGMVTVCAYTEAAWTCEIALRDWDLLWRRCASEYATYSCEPSADGHVCTLATGDTSCAEVYSRWGSLLTSTCTCSG